MKAVVKTILSVLVVLTALGVFAAIGLVYFNNGMSFQIKDSSSGVKIQTKTLDNSLDTVLSHRPHTLKILMDSLKEQE